MNEKTLYWNRRPGKFVNKNTGEGINLVINGQPFAGAPDFNGSVREWYETLVETIIDLRNQLHRDAGKNSREINVTVDPDVRCILESTVLFKPNLDGKPRSRLVGTLCGMNVFESKKAARFEIEMEFKTGSSIERGCVIVRED